MEFNGTFFVTIITFIVFVFLMNKILYAPVLGIMEARKKFIEGNYADVKDNDAKVEKISEEKSSLLKDARETAKDKYTEKVETFKLQKENVVSEAQEASENNLKTSNIELINLSNEVKEGLKGSMLDLASDIVEKVIGYRSEVENMDSQKVDEILYH